MLPGPSIVIACPHCGTLAQYRTLLSGNTFNARMWTDGRQIAPMLPRPPQFVDCHRCHEVYALRDAEEVGKLTFEGEPAQPAWESSPTVEEPNEAAYYEALSKCDSDGDHTERLRNMRILTWWSRNNRYRDNPDGAAPGADSDDPRWRENAESLLDLLGDETNDQFMRVELLRQLGRPAEALTLLNSIEGPAEVKRALRALCESGDTQVREFKF